MADHVVKTAAGLVRGSDGTFKGIPYAAPPEGPLRFRPPAPPEPWDGVRECVTFAAALGGPGLGYAPVIDGDVVPGPPWEVVPAAVDLICGYTHEEFRGLGIPIPSPLDVAAVAARLGVDAATYRAASPAATDADLFAEMLSDVLMRVPTTRTAEAHTAAGGRTWLYDFAWQGPMGAGHGVDVPFTFGNADSRYAARLIGSPAPPDFADLSARLRTSWTTFAATGDPGWPRFDPEGRHTHVWGA